ncbi:LOW QUALITY PROTEIN: PE-PGRS family protein, partial [Mycobacterium tuberculosis GM 1503]
MRDIRCWTDRSKAMSFVVARRRCWRRPLRIKRASGRHSGKPAPRRWRRPSRCQPRVLMR